MTTVSTGLTEHERFDSLPFATERDRKEARDFLDQHLTQVSARVAAAAMERQAAARAQADKAVSQLDAVLADAKEVLSELENGSLDAVEAARRMERLRNGARHASELFVGALEVQGRVREVLADTWAEDDRLRRTHGTHVLSQFPW